MLSTTKEQTKRLAEQDKGFTNFAFKRISVPAYVETVLVSSIEGSNAVIFYGNSTRIIIDKVLNSKPVLILLNDNPRVREFAENFNFNFFAHCEISDDGSVYCDKGETLVLLPENFNESVYMISPTVKQIYKYIAGKNDAILCAAYNTKLLKNDCDCNRPESGVAFVYKNYRPEPEVIDSASDPNLLYTAEEINQLRALLSAAKFFSDTDIDTLINKCFVRVADTDIYIKGI